MNSRKLLQYSVQAVGLIDALIGVIIFVAPQWFFETIGTFPPFNRHYMGDVASFLLPLGIGLFFAGRDPVKHRLLIGVGALGSALHVVNHLVDDIAGPLDHLLIDVTPLVLLVVPLVISYLQPQRES